MVRTLILIESGIFIGVLLISNLLRRFRRSKYRRNKSHPSAAFYVIGKLSMGVSWAFLFVPAANGLSSDIPIARACEYMAAALLLSGILFALPAFLELGYDSRFGISAQAGKLRTDGIYRASRNPMYLAFYMVTLASWLATPRPANIICGLVGMYIHHRIVLAEERFLLEQHGALYEAYRNKVRRYL